MKLIYPV